MNLEERKEEIKKGKNPFKNQAGYFFSICNFDVDSEKSDKVDLRKFPQLLTSNGGSWYRTSSSFGKTFNLTTEKDGPRNVFLQIDSFKKNEFDAKISKAIQNKIKNQRCVILQIGDVEADHKDGRKDDFGLPIRQKETDFQPLSKAANVAKRQHCKRCKELNLRFDAKKIGYKESTWTGGIKYNHTCVGCYLYDPIMFNQKMSANFKKRKKRGTYTSK